MGPWGSDSRSGARRHFTHTHSADKHEDCGYREAVLLLQGNVLVAVLICVDEEGTDSLWRWATHTWQDSRLSPRETLCTLISFTSHQKSPGRGIVLTLFPRRGSSKHGGSPEPPASTKPLAPANPARHASCTIFRLILTATL